jgi:hypothetical protein
LHDSGEFLFAELSFSFDTLLRDLHFEIDEDKYKINPSQYWNEVFYRLEAAAVGKKRTDAVEEARHVAGEFILEEIIKDSEMKQEAEKAAELFRLKNIDEFKIHE